MLSSCDLRAHAPSERLVALAVARAGALALVLRGVKRWRHLQSYTMAPMELPGVRVDEGATPEVAAETAGSVALGGRARVLPSLHTYGRSAAHAIDRIGRCPVPGLAPLIYLERGVPTDDVGAALRWAEVCVYRGALDGGLSPGSSAAGLFWLPLGALRQAVRGLPLDELLGMPGVVWLPKAGVEIPDDLFVFVPAEYGERHLLRVAAKYGERAIFQEEGESQHGA